MAFRRYAQVVLGPAGSGKSTYCKLIQSCAELQGRTVRVVNLDPAAESFHYRCDVDIRDCISLDDVMSEMDLGPNGGLVFALEYLVENISWLEEELDMMGEDDYLLFDCPGQIELYTHLPVMATLTKALKTTGFSLCAMYCVDCTFLSDASKFISASLMALATMQSLGLSHINVLTKCDLVANKQHLSDVMEMTPEELKGELNSAFRTARFQALNEALSGVLESFNLVQFFPIDPTDDDTIQSVLYQADMALQFFEGREVNTRDFDEAQEMDIE